LVVGTGFGCRIHVPALRAAGFEVVGLVGADIERTRKRAENNGIAQAFTDLDEAIARTKAKVVSVATTPHTHAPLTLTAIARGCHVLCEKPFAKDATEARAVLGAAQRAGVAHVIGHEFRLAPDRALFARVIAEGLIGKPKLATVMSYLPLVASPEAKMPKWWFDEGAGGGWLGAHGSHIVDQVRAALGEFVSLSATLSTVAMREGAVAEDTYSVRFQMANGVEGILQHTAGAWGPPTSITRTSGTEGTVWIEGGTVKIADRNGARDLPVPADLVLPPLPPLPSSEAGQRPPGPELQAFIRLSEAFLAMVEGRSPPTPVPVATFAEGVACMEVLDAIRKSAASGGELIKLR
jgi:predicted dehydrogenase